MPLYNMRYILYICIGVAANYVRVDIVSIFAPTHGADY
jgi:hypothetical protein